MTGLCNNTRPCILRALNHIIPSTDCVCYFLCDPDRPTPVVPESSRHWPPLVRYTSSTYHVRRQTRTWNNIIMPYWLQRVPQRCGIDTSIYIVIIIIHRLWSNNLSRTTAHPCNRASAQPRNLAPTAGLREPPPPRIAFTGFGKPPTRLLVFPARCLHVMASQLPRMGGYPQYEEGANTPSRTLLLSYVVCRTDPLLS